MRRLLIWMAFLAPGLLSSPAHLTAQEVLGSETRPFLVKYQNGMVEKYIIQWTANLAVNHWESGGPAKPLEGKFVDDRQCHWTTNATVIRRVYLTNQGGELFEKKDLATPFESNFKGEGAGFKLIQFRPENCGDAEARYQSDLSDSRRALRANLPGVIKNDMPDVLAVMKAWANVKEVSEEKKAAGKAK
jgi:hypothetical protein